MNEKIAQLFKFGGPCELEGDVDKLGWHDYLQYGFTEADVPELIEVLVDKSLHTSYADDDYWVPLYAWRILGQLKTVDAIAPLISMFNFLDEEENDWAIEETPHVMAMIGASAIDPLIVHLLDDSNTEYSRVMASDSLRKIGECYPEHRDEIVEKFRLYTSSPDEAQGTLNGLVISALIDLKAVELIDDIRNMFQQECVDMMVRGDIEDVEITLGLRKERETPKPNFGLLSELFNSSLVGFDGDYEDSSYDYSAVNPKAETYVREGTKVGRNDPCSCGSGKKFKKCCLNS